MCSRFTYNRLSTGMNDFSDEYIGKIFFVLVPLTTADVGL